MNVLTASAVGFATLGLLWTGTAPAQEAIHKGLVLVQRTVDAKYDASSPLFPALLQSPLTQPYLVKQGDSLQKIVSEKFGMGPSVTPDLYEGMASRIQELNDIGDRSAIQAGAQLKLPDLPPVQWRQPGAANPNYGVPRVQPGPSYSSVLQGRLPSVAGAASARKILDAGRKAERLVNQWRWLTLDEAKAEAAVSGPATHLTYWAQPITLKLAQGSPAAPGTPTVASDLQFLAALVKRRAPQQEVVVYVLDDSWPSDSAFETSRSFLVNALNIIRKANYFGDGNLPEALSNGSAKTNFPLQAPGRHSHAALINASLSDFSKLTPRVKVVYLPLFTEQKWSKELWQELTYTTLVASAMHSKLGDAEPTIEIKKQAQGDASQLVGQIPGKAIDSLGPAQQTPITVLEKFAQLYSQTTGIPFFISMSWTVEEHEIEFGPDPDALGVSLAASGNDKKDVVGDAVYLAYRAKASPGDVLAVMNTDGTGQELCGSSTLPLSGPNAFYGLAYDGTFNVGTPECGSSFSTPRVAWLLALRQAYNAPIPKSTWPYWYASFRTSVIALQSSTQTTSRRYWLPVAKLFDGL